MNAGGISEKGRELAAKNREEFKRKKFGGSGRKFLKYPIENSMGEKTGDRLLIKCVQFEPPTGGSGTTIITENLFKYDENGNYAGILGKGDTAFNEKGEKIVGGEDKIKLGFETTDANSRLSKDMNFRTIYMVELPIPQDITDSNSVTWGEDRMNVLELAALNVAQTAMTGNLGENIVQTAEAAVTMLNTGVEIPGLTADTQAAVRAALSGAAIGALGSNVSARSVISRSTGQILNNNLELLFQGVNLRSFPFSITFSPRGPEESAVVKDIIRSFKMSMAPKAGEIDGSVSLGMFLKSPDVFQLRYMKDDVDHPFLNAFKLCALTGMSVNYTNAGTYATYEDGTPVNIRMNLTFKELNPIYHEDYTQAAAGMGVGY
jgi:hypothetical protein